MSSANVLPLIDQGLHTNNNKPSPPTTPPSKNVVGINSVRNRKTTNHLDKHKKQKHHVVLETYEKRINAARHRNKYVHNLCLDILKEGYHSAFAELFALLQRQQEDRLKCADDPVASSQPLLEDEHDKLNFLCENLCKAEDAMRKDKDNVIYDELRKLALYFDNGKDSWLADNFYLRCLQVSERIRDDDGKTQSEANCNLGVSFVNRGEVDKALPFLEAFYNLTKDRDWSDENGQRHFSLACEHLCRVYTEIADKISKEDLDGSIKYLLEAYEVAKEGGSKHAEGISSYRLGCAFSNNDDPQTALTYHNSYLEICLNEEDDTGAAQAYEAIARCYEDQGNIESTLNNLEKFAEVSEKSGQLKDFGKACTKLGGMFNSMGNYSKAVDYFGKAFNIAQDMNDSEVLDMARVQFGIAKAHKMADKYIQYIESNDRNSLAELLKWKSTRSAIFTNEE